MKLFGNRFVDVLRKILNKILPFCPLLMLFGYNQKFDMSFQEKQIILAVSTAVEKKKAFSKVGLN